MHDLVISGVRVALDTGRTNAVFAISDDLIHRRPETHGLIAERAGPVT